MHKVLSNRILSHPAPSGSQNKYSIRYSNTQYSKTRRAHNSSYNFGGLSKIPMNTNCSAFGNARLNSRSGAKSAQIRIELIFAHFHSLATINCQYLQGTYPKNRSDVSETEFSIPMNELFCNECASCGREYA